MNRYLNVRLQIHPAEVMPTVWHSRRHIMSMWGLRGFTGELVRWSWLVGWGSGRNAIVQFPKQVVADRSVTIQVVRNTSTRSFNSTRNAINMPRTLLEAPPGLAELDIV